MRKRKNKPHLVVYSVDTDYTYKVPETTLHQICDCVKLSTAIKRGLTYAQNEFDAQIKSVKYSYDKKHKWLTIDYNAECHCLRITNVTVGDWVSYVEAAQKS